MDTPIPARMVQLFNEGQGRCGKSRSLDVLLGAIRSHLGMDVAFIAEFVGGHRVYRYVSSGEGAQPVHVGQSDPLESSYCARIVDGRLPGLIRDTRLYSEASRLPSTSELGIGAYVGVPLRMADGSVYGTFCCYRSAPDYSLTQRDMAMMEVFAEVAGDHIHRELRDSRRRTEISSRISRVLTSDGVKIAYQPIVDLASGQTAGYECLSRFPGHPSRPDEWFRDAAAVGLGVELETAAIRAALSGLPHLPEPAFLTLNTSPSLLSGEVLETVFADAPLHRLVLEITEGEIVSDYEKVAAALWPLRQRGLRIAVDDAGAGYASFRHVLNIQPELIKLDMSLIRAIDQHRGQQALAAALVGFAGQMGAAVVAEGVENAEELECVRALGVSLGQGFHFGRPDATFRRLGSLRDPRLRHLP